MHWDRNSKKDEIAYVVQAYRTPFVPIVCLPIFVLTFRQFIDDLPWCGLRFGIAQA